MEEEKASTATKQKPKDKPEGLAYVRSTVLGLFSFLNINNMDAATILSAFECIDTKFHQRVDVALFGRTYVGEFDDVMIMLWETFYEIMDLKKLKPPPVLVVEKSTSEQEGVEDHSVKHHHDHHHDYKQKPLYIHFLSFLIFIMYVDDRDLPYIIYWMYIHRNKKENVNGDTLNNLVRKMWGTKKSPHRQKEATKNFKSVALTLRLVTDYKDFNPNKFRLYDISSRSAFTKNFHRIRSEIAINIAGNAFWKRLRLQLTEILSNDDIDAAMDKIADANIRKNPYQETGTRKEIRKETRRFLRALRDYSEMPTGEDVKETKPSLMSTIIGTIKGHPLFETLRMKKIMPYLRGPSSTSSTSDVQEEHNVSLEKKHRKALKVNAEQLHDKAVRAKERAEQLILSCNGISAADVIKRGANNGNGDEYYNTHDIPDPDGNENECNSVEEDEENDNGAEDFNK